MAENLQTLKRLLVARDYPSYRLMNVFYLFIYFTAVKMPESGCNSLLLSEEFLDNCMELFSVPSRALEATQKPFQIKHLNIIDPLKENNNLGRSVHRGENRN